MSETNIPVTEEARRELRTFKSRHDETYSEAILRLLEAYDG